MTAVEPHYHRCTFGCTAGTVPAARVLPGGGVTRVRWGVDYHREGQPVSRAKGLAEDEARALVGTWPGARLIRSTITVWPDDTSSDFAGAEFLGPWVAVSDG